MSVRDGLLAILTLGPAYGLQLHAEFSARATHRKPVNVGQVYATLDRLTKQGLVEHAGSTSDGLPLYAVTSEGERVAGLWMSTPDVSALPEWTEMLDQVLVSSSVEPTSALSLSRAYRRWWETDLAETRSSLASGQGDRLALLAREAQSVAALAWLGAAIAEVSELDTARPLSAYRPKRGRRPQQASSSAAE
jgi:DNA-binding PadR family transcriptional regulator